MYPAVSNIVKKQKKTIEKIYLVGEFIQFYIIFDQESRFFQSF